jgi:hypothetical protein
VRDAAALVDPADTDDAIMALYEVYEDDDRPVTAVEDLAGTLIATAEGIDPEGDDGAVLATAAAAAWIGTHPRDRNEDHQADHVIREAVRMAFGKETPRQVVDFLATRNI